MTENELRDYYNIYTNCWKMFKTHSVPVDQNVFWENLMSFANKIYESSS